MSLGIWYFVFKMVFWLAVLLVADVGVVVCGCGVAKYHGRGVV